MREPGSPRDRDVIRDGESKRLRGILYMRTQIQEHSWDGRTRSRSTRSTPGVSPKLASTPQDKQPSILTSGKSGRQFLGARSPTCATAGERLATPRDRVRLAASPS